MKNIGVSAPSSLPGNARHCRFHRKWAAEVDSFQSWTNPGKLPPLAAGRKCTDGRITNLMVLFGLHGRLLGY
jgi:hypothetical protein